LDHGRLASLDAELPVGPEKDPSDRAFVVVDGPRDGDGGLLAVAAEPAQPVDLLGSGPSAYWTVTRSSRAGRRARRTSSRIGVYTRIRSFPIGDALLFGGARVLEEPVHTQVRELIRLEEG
jgi:hypothetical protein